VAADYVCQAIDPQNPNGPRIDVIFPAGYTLGLYKHSSVDFENLRAARCVLENTDRIFSAFASSTRADGATRDDHKCGLFENESRCHFRRTEYSPST